LVLRQEKELSLSSDDENLPIETSPLPIFTPAGQLAIENRLSSEPESAPLTRKITVVDKGKSLVKKVPYVAKHSRSTPILSTSASTSADILKTVALKSISADSSVDSVCPSPTNAFLSFKQKRDSLTLRQTVKRAKFSVCNLADSSAKSRLTEARLRVLISVMTAREMLNEPLQKTEIPPDDLLNLLFNPIENI
jgi:hypothetical protein